MQTETQEMKCWHLMHRKTMSERLAAEAFDYHSCKVFIQQYFQC